MATTTEAVQINLTEVDGREAGDLEADMYFLSRDPTFNTVKPYSLRYPPHGDLPQSNIARTKETIMLRNFRDYKNSLPFDQCGFGLMEMESRMTFGDFADADTLSEVYAEEIRERLKAKLSAKHVFVMDYAVRRRDATFPISTGKDYEHDQPTRMAHIDFTREEAVRMIQRLYGDRAHEVLNSRWQIVNVWKPLIGPLRDWPLALCDARSVDFKHDTMPADIVFPDWVTENLQIHHNSSHEWYWLADQTPSELLIFKSADSDPDSNPASPHAGFYNRNVGPDDAPRQSIDCRTFVFYADLEEWPPEVGNVFFGHQ